MSETETHNPENYYFVDIAGLAQFVINASDEIFADLRLREYCKENSFLRVDPDSHFDIFNSIEEIPYADTVAFRKYQFAQQSVRLMGLREPNIIPLVAQPQPNKAFRMKQQLELFE